MKVLLNTELDENMVANWNLEMTIIDKMRNNMKRRYALDYTINTSINVSMVDFKNAGLTDEEILKLLYQKNMLIVLL